MNNKTVTVIYTRADGATINSNVHTQQVKTLVNSCRCHAITAAIYDDAGNLIAERHPRNPGDENTSDPYAIAWHDVHLPGD